MSPNHLPRLDALRSLAVTLVVIFHLVPDKLPGGFIGVDMFFCLSGFLMTRLYLQSQSDSRYRPTAFLLRRFWRIYPPLVVTIGLTIVASALLFSPEHLLRAADSGLFALLSVSNWYFFGQAGYFDTDSIFKPLLHTWSLGTEEQFYLLFAVGLAVAKWLPLSRCLAAIGAASLILWAYVLVADQTATLSQFQLPSWHLDAQSAVFFLPQYRIYQFAAGALVAYVLLNNQRCPTWLHYSAVPMLLLSVYLAGSPKLSDLSTPMITLASCLLIYQSKLLDQVGTWLPVRYTARISYQIYLVHWPVIVLYQYWSLEPLSSVGIVTCLVLSLLLSDGLYRATNPLRRT